MDSTTWARVQKWASQEGRKSLSDAVERLVVLMLEILDKKDNESDVKP